MLLILLVRSLMYFLGKDVAHGIPCICELPIDTIQPLVEADMPNSSNMLFGGGSAGAIVAGIIAGSPLEWRWFFWITR